MTEYRNGNAPKGLSAASVPAHAAPPAASPAPGSPPAAAPVPSPAPAAAVPPTLYVVVPCFNEEAVLPLTNGLFTGEIAHLREAGKVSAESRVLYVDDGSSDGTWGVIECLAAQFPEVEGMGLSRNRGHQNALLAGLMEVRGRCDICISIDCDGQDDVAAMERMVDAYAAGFDVVYGVRATRKADSAFKRTSAQLFYRLLSASGVESVYNHADYRLLSARVLNELARFEEVNLYLRGMVPLVGFASTSVYYDRTERVAGEGHYPLRKMVSLALNGITSLSVKPIRLVAGIGMVFSLLGLAGMVWAVAVALAGLSVSGWASTICIICFFGGLQLLALGIIGEYVGKIYLEVKRRPRYIVAARTWEE